MSVRGHTSTSTKKEPCAAAYAKDLVTVRAKLAQLAAAPSAGGRTKRLFAPPANVASITGTTDAVAGTAAAAATGNSSILAPRPLRDSADTRNNSSCSKHPHVQAPLDTISPRPTASPSVVPLVVLSGGGPRTWASGGGKHNDGVAGNADSLVSENLLEASTIETMQATLTMSPPAVAASPTRPARVIAIRRQSVASPPVPLTPQNFATAFRNNVNFSPKLWSCVLYRTPASAHVVVAARRRVFRLMLQRTAQMLSDASIKLPLNVAKLSADHRVALGRELSKGLFNTNIYLRQNPSLDLREDILARRIAFQDTVDRNVTFLVAWEVAMAAKPTSGGSSGSSSRGVEGSKQRRRKTPQTQKRGGGGGEAKRAFSFVVTHDSVASRRLSRRASLADLSKAAHGSTSSRCSGVLDVRAILATPYGGPVVSDVVKQRYARNHQPPSPSPRSPIHRRDSPPNSKRSARRTPSRTSGIVFAGEEGGNTMSPVRGESGGDGGRWSDLTGGLFEASLNAPQTQTMPLAAVREKKHGVAPLPAAKARGNKKPLGSAAAVSPVVSSDSKLVEPLSGAVYPLHSPSRSRSKPPLLAPLPRDVQIAASRLGDRDGPSQVMDQLASYETSIQEGCEERNPSVQFWFGKSSRPALDRTTASMRMRQLSPQVLSFFDEKGLIDGRAGTNVACRPRDGILYSEDRIVQARKAAAALEVKALRQRMSSGGASVGEGDGDDNVTSEDGGTSLIGQQQNGSDPLPRQASVGSHHHHHRSSGGGVPRVDYGPDHRTNKSRDERSIAEPSVERLRDLLSTVFVRGGDVRTFVRRIGQEAKYGLKKPDIRRSNKDRLGGGAVSRSVLQ